MSDLAFAELLLLLKTHTGCLSLSGDCNLACCKLDEVVISIHEPTFARVDESLVEHLEVVLSFEILGVHRHLFFWVRFECPVPSEELTQAVLDLIPSEIGDLWVLT